MGGILSNWRISLAVLFSAGLIVSAYLLARSIGNPPLAVASEEAALLQAIASRDTDGDGLPDWEESLYGTDPNIVDTLKLGMTDREAVSRGLVIPKAIAEVSTGVSTQGAPVHAPDGSLPPSPAEGTLTAAFAKNFFTLYISAKQANGGANLSKSEMESIARDALDQLSAVLVTAPDFKSAQDIKVEGTGADALMQFAVTAEAVLLKNTSTAKMSEIQYLKRALQENDTEAFTHMASLAKAYRDSAAGLSALGVPRELAAADLAFINALMRLSEIITDFTRANTDPLATMLALKQYPQAAIALSNSLVMVGEVYKNAGLTLPANAPGASFVNIIADLSATSATP